MNDIRAISFDIDHTLLDFDAVMNASLTQALAYLHREYPHSTMNCDDLLRIYDETIAHADLTQQSYAEIRRQAFINTAKRVDAGNTSLGEQLANVYFQHRFAEPIYFADALPLLDKLDDIALPFGFITNANSNLDYLGLRGRVAFASYAEDVGMKKPAPETFAHALAQLHRVGIDCQPHQLMHVGDSLDSDVAGARDFGAVSVWLNRAGEENDSDIRPDIEIASLSELSL